MISAIPDLTGLRKADTELAISIGFFSSQIDFLTLLFVAENRSSEREEEKQMRNYHRRTLHECIKSVFYEPACESR